ncbi:Cyclin, N-terminal domain-containing protein [Cladochytrium replicatum]|nr:Cyclin, N-terminal domain-containing protein [Cladochytrium replicatum]
MDSQPDLSFRMRKTLIVWLVEVHNEYDLRQETLYLAINILDRFCARRLVPRPQYQLLGITALWIAAKYEENHGRVPSLRMLCYICCQNYRERDLVAMEGVVLRELGFELGHPTPEAFLKATVKLMRSPVIVSPETRAVARYLMEISTVHARYHRFKPSVLATSALALADHILLEGPLVLPEADTQTSATMKDDMDDVMRRCEAFLTDCLSDPPKQIFAKYAGGKFLRASMIAERWCKR